MAVPAYDEKEQNFCTNCILQIANCKLHNELVSLDLAFHLAHFEACKLV